MPAPLKAIFFDVGNTLLFPDRTHILAPLHQRNLKPTLDHWHAIARKTKKEFDAILQGKRHARFGELVRYPATHAREPAAAGTTLSACGISNADGKIADVLERCGIVDCFRTITDSGLVGHEKPHPAIFEVALRELSVAPEEILYVGDMYSVDYVGATRAGMQAILFDVPGAYRDSGLPRVESLEELEQKV
ncbi:MAG: HAD family hydrolase [Terriglobales bacterium]